MNLYNYDNGKLFINWPRFTESVDVECGFDGDYVVFDDATGLLEFIDYLEENGVDTGTISRHSFGTWDENAIKLSDLI